MAESGKSVTETQLVRIAYGLIEYTGVYQDDCWMWRNKATKTWTEFQEHFIESHAVVSSLWVNPRHGKYGEHNTKGIKEAFYNLVQATTEDRAAVTNLTDANKTLLAQVR